MPVRLGPWRIERALGRDLLGQYYAARRDDGERATLYLVPGEPTDGRREALARLVRLHRELFHPGLIRFRGVDRDSDELYAIADAADPALVPLRTGFRPPPAQIPALGASVAAALGVAHDRGLVHGGLELDSILWAPEREPQILGTGVAAMSGDRTALVRGDVAALGRVLCALVIRQPQVADRRMLEVIQRIADPSAGLAMRDVHDLLAEGESTRTGHGAGSGSGPASAGGDVGETLGGADTATVMDDLTGGSGAGTASEVPAPAPELARYRILARLGRGGMGEVFLAQDPVLRRAVALKRLRPDLERDPLFRARLRHEAQVAARLTHRAIVQIFDLVGDDDCLVMEYVPGPSLHALLGGRPLPVAEVVRIAAELADGLAYAHQHGIIHRDLKLENVLIGPDRQPKLTDFGIARRTVIAEDSTAQVSLTRGRGIVGTLRAMSPEQLRGRELDGRSDLFSFGVMLYELVTGGSPFASGSDAETIASVLHHRQLPAHELVPGTPRALSELIDQLLEKSATERPDSALALRDRLRAIELPPEPAEAPAGRPPLAEPTPDPPPADAPVTAGNRRQVTLVAIELTAHRGDDGPLGDPELLAGVLPAFRARIDEILARTDGALISALGLRFVTCFGHPRPLEDAAHRAVLAGRAMLDAATGLRSIDPVYAGVGFTACGAVHTGVAVAGGRGGRGDDELVLGATLDAALRLLALGGAVQLWLSAAAAPLVETEFQLERAAALPDGASPAWRLVGRLAAGTGSGERDRPMVARDHEMQLLLGGWRHARQGRGQAALLIGEPGIGKSRLVRALADAIAGDQPRQIVLGGNAHRRRSALEPVTEAITALLATGGGGDTTADRIRALTGPDEAEQVLHLLGRPAGHLTAAHERARHQLLCGLRDVLVGGGPDATTLLVVEDLHWLDPSTLDLVALIVQGVASWPVFVVMTTRPGFQPPWPATAGITQLRLRRLEAPEIDAVIAHACRDRALSAAERAVIAARSEGVPLYAEELVRAALEL
ncbi:MAG TPA: protein kinase, partial [Kofleriaceae bacterium]